MKIAQGSIKNVSKQAKNKATKSTSGRGRKGNKAVKSTSKQKLINKMMRYDQTLKNTQLVRSSIQQQSTARKSTTGRVRSEAHTERESFRNMDNHLDETEADAVCDTSESVKQPETSIENRQERGSVSDPLVEWYRKANKRILVSIDSKFVHHHFELLFVQLLHILCLLNSESIALQ